MHPFINTLKAHLQSNRSAFENGESVLEMLYDCYEEAHPYDNDQIKADFRALYETMNGMPLREKDQILYPVCTLCRDHERSGFIDGVKVGFRLKEELSSSFSRHRRNQSKA